ncbi:MAG TPA: sugar ABC transporter permease [bacterium]|nr:sugar ABC transporter permease [bacterium]
MSLAERRSVERTGQLRRRLRVRATPFLLLLPAALLLGAVAAYPLLGAARLSLLEFRINAPERFVGLDNFSRILTDPQTLASMGITAIFVAGSVTILLLLAYLLALLLYQDFPGRRIIRTVVLIPWALAPVVNGLMWKSLYAPNFGPLNDLLGRLGLIAQSVNWVTEFPMPSLILAYVWKVLPFPTLIILAGLESVPAELYEAAQVDGAGSGRRFRHITLPLLQTVTLLATILVLVDALHVFAIVDILTRGGPGGQTMVLNYTIFRTAFRYLDFGYGAAMAFTLTAVILLLSFLYVRASAEAALVTER